ncbi:MAG: N-ethylammeline chlorohydrolase [Methylophilaceae bacterium 17-44-8]|nr:MAG: N-ethylammeline chlorohydrolase [Methylophilaceae bacterium 17-44-8]
MLKSVGLIICARWVLPIIPKDGVLEHHAVVIHHGKIIDICAQSLLEERYVADETVVLDEHVIMPGLINLHTHAAMSLMRGLADDLPLKPWLQQHIWPAEQAFVSPKFVYDGTLLACAEMLSGGVTTFNDMYFFPESTIQASTKIGMRAHIGLVVLEFATNYANTVDTYLEKGTAIRDAYKSEPLISFSFAPHAPYTVSDDTFNKISVLADQLDMGIHTHLQETLFEVNESQSMYGLSPLKRFANLGLLSSKLVLAHCVHLSEADMQLLAEYGCHIAHCPASNLKLASGIAPIAQYAALGINIGIGTDGAASNNRLDMFAEMRLAALLAKGISGDATVVSAHRALEMATINGAKALGLDHTVGSIEVGKMADLTAVKLTDFYLQPCFDIASHLVYVAGRENVTHTWVAGELKYHQPDANAGVFSDVEPHDVLQIAQNWQRTLAMTASTK